MEIKKYNILGSKWYNTKLIIEGNSIKDAECNCIWGKNNQNAWKKGKYCKHIEQAKNLFELELFSRKRKKKQMIGKEKLTEKEIETLRGMVLYTCEECEKHEGEVGKLTPHRIQRGYKGGKYCPRNIRMVCSNCHKIYHSDEFE